jgi:hypothetical protein
VRVGATAPTAGMSRMILMPAVGVVAALTGATVVGVVCGRVGHRFRCW